MMESLVNGKHLKLVKGDITALGVEAFVFYARSDLKLGTGFGGAIAQRGGATIQQELDRAGNLETGKSVVTSAGNLKAKYIVHSVGPKHHEENEEKKLRETIREALQAAKAKNIRQLAFPAMGAGFYGVSLALCGKVMAEEICSHFRNETTLDEVIICLLDNREMKAFSGYFGSIGEGKDD